MVYLVSLCLQLLSWRHIFNNSQRRNVFILYFFYNYIRNKLLPKPNNPILHINSRLTIQPVLVLILNLFTWQQVR